MTTALAPIRRPAARALPALVQASGKRAGVRILEFFAVKIRNPHTRRAYARAVGEFLAWCESVGGVPSLPAVSGHEPKRQRLGVNVLFVAVVLVVVGSLAGEWLGIEQKLGNLWFW